MGRFDGIAILSDMDNTFLSSEGKCVPRNIRAIRTFIAEGGLFALSTGRMNFNLDQLVPDLYEIVNAPSILCNGAYLYDFSREKILSQKFMDGTIGYRAVEICRDFFPLVNVRVSDKDGFLFDARDAVFIDEMKKSGIAAFRTLPFEKWEKDGWYKIACQGAPETLAVLEQRIKTECPGAFEYNRSRATMLEMQETGTDKAAMLPAFRAYCESIGNPVRVYACGDYENDVPILKKADVAVCPSNSLDSIKAMCRYCLGSNDEGVIADLIELLGRQN